jgi:hypothetical protein
VRKEESSAEIEEAPPCRVRNEQGYGLLYSIRNTIMF